MNTVPSGQVVTLTATVKPGTVGQVNFCDAAAPYCTDIHLLGTAQLTTAGTAVFQYIPGLGSHSYKAELAGIAVDAMSSSSVANLNVTPKVVQTYPTTTTIAQSGNAGNYTLTATVIGTGGTVAPTGTVSFLDTSNGGATLGTAALGAGTGKSGLSWTNSQTPATKPDPQSIVVLDFNGDGIPDLAVGNNSTSGAGFVSILLGNGDGTFTSRTANNIPALANNQNLAVAAFVTGGPQDILIVSSSVDNTNNAGILFGGSTSLSTPFSLPLGSVSAVATGDFNRDGKQDFIVGGQQFGVTSVAVFFGNGDGTFGTPTIIPVGTAPISIAVGDFQGNGHLDFAVADSGTNTFSVFLNDGSGNFSQGPGSSVNGTAPVSMVAADFNEDGKVDLAIANSDSDTVTILLGNGDGSFKAAVSPATGSSPSWIAVGDFNGDGKADLAVANHSSNTVTILLGNGDGTFTAQTSPPTGVAPTSVAVGNFNGAGTADLAVVNSTDSTVTVLLSQAGFTATASASSISVAGSGAHLVDASYPGDGTYEASVSGTISLGAKTISTTLALTASPASVSLGQQVSLTAALAPYTAGGATSNGETITFNNGTTRLGTATLSSGVATLSTTSLPAGSNSVTATYAGDANFTTSVSTAVPVTVNAPVPAVTLSRSSLTFAPETIGATSTAQSVTLTNTGQAALSITSVVVTGDFAETNTCGTSVGVGSMCSISVSFTPGTGGARSGTLTIADNATGSPQSVSLSGGGESVGLTASTTALTISSAGGSATATIQVAQVSDFTGMVNLTCAVTYQGTGTPRLPPTCSLNPAQVQITGNSGTSSILTVNTSAKNASALMKAALEKNAPTAHDPLLRNSAMALAALFLFGILPRRRWRKGLLFGFLCMFVIGGVIGCGSSSKQGTTVGSYQVLVTATSGMATASTTIPLTVQ